MREPVKFSNLCAEAEMDGRKYSAHLNIRHYYLGYPFINMVKFEGK